MLMTTYMYKNKDMDMLTMEQYLNWKKTLPGLRLRVQLDRSVCNCGEQSSRYWKTQQAGTPSRRRAARSTTADTCKAAYSVNINSSRSNKIIPGPAKFVYNMADKKIGSV